jgi:hypothetical protein
MRVLLGQLGARGDCLYATAVARQIKKDYPGCHLTWGVGSMCRSILDLNPHVDSVWEIPMASHSEMADAWKLFYRQALERRAAGEFDRMFFTQIHPDGYENYDGTVRASIFRGYPRRITVPIAPVLRLTADEISNAGKFAERHGLSRAIPVVLFEFSAVSAQSFMTPELAQEIALAICELIPECKIVLTSHVSLPTSHSRIIDGSGLSFRENAEITKYCSLLVGCSSGISWLCTSDWADPLPTIQLLSKKTSVYASMVHDHEYFGLPTDAIIEMTESSASRIAECATAALQRGFQTAKSIYHEKIAVSFKHYEFILEAILRREEYRQASKSVWNTIKRYGPRRALLAAVKGAVSRHMEAQKALRHRSQ